MVDGSQNQRRRRLSRREFVKYTGAAGTVAGVAGCITTDPKEGANQNKPKGNGGDTETPIDTTAPTEEVTVQWAADSRMKDNAPKVKAALHEAGLPDNITVDILAGSQVTDKRQSQYQQWLRAGQSEPDLLMMDSGWTIPFIARGQLQNLSATLPAEMIDPVENEYLPRMVESAKMDGDLYGIPLFPSVATILYRKDLVKEAGYDPEGENWAKEGMSWKQFSEVISKTKEQTGTKYGFSFQAKVYEGLACCTFPEFMHSWGGAYFGGTQNLFGPVGERPITVDEKPVNDALRMIRTFVHGADDEHAMEGYAGGFAPNAVLQWSEEPSRKPFTNGQAVAHRNWAYAIKINGKEEAFGEDLGIMPIPHAVSESESNYENIGGHTSSLGGWHVSMNPNSKKKAASLQVIKALMNEQFRLDLLEIMGLLPPIPSLFNSEKAKEVPVMGRYMDTLKIAAENSIPRPTTVVWPQQKGKIADRINACIAGEVAPEDATAEIKSSLETIEQKAGQGE
ncbi:extracellular solute-binding protein [Haladaptatus sp. DYSN1]|uniref:extracellular solute-binding protein n=1 Tax=unclassified Haladaptatus TaxID=2622732 RepID=UPI0024059D27|nr:extracellular solute-binding protein [Haladaptatus sp. DYSN1]